MSPSLSRVRAPVPAILAAALAALLISCASLPLPSDPGGWLGMLPPDSSVFVAADVSASRELLERLVGQAGAGERRARNVMERTNRAYAGLSLAAGQPVDIALVAIGDFGPAAVAFSLSFDRNWVRRTMADGKSGGGTARTLLPDRGGGPGERAMPPEGSPWQPGRTYWEHRETGLQLASPRPGVVLMSDRSVEEMLGRFAGAGELELDLPPDARDDLEPAELFLYFPTLPAIVGIAEISLLPIRSFWASARGDGSGYLISAVITLEGVSNERAVERLIRLLIPLLLRRAQVDDLIGKTKAVDLSVNSSRVRIDSLRLSTEEVMRFLTAVVAPGEGRGAGSR